LAIKDEFEVARLYSRPEFLNKITSQFEGDFKLQFHLAPPLFGGGKKSGYGSWMLRALKLLANVRRIRNTWMDPFARTHERQVEIGWLRDYERMLNTVGADLSSANYDLAVQLLELPDAVRGYGPVKDRYLANAKARQSVLLAQWAVPKFSDAAASSSRSTIALKQI